MLTQIQVVNGIIIMINFFFKIRGSCLRIFIAAVKFLWKNASFLESNGPVCLHKGCTCKREILKSVSSPNTFLRWIPTWEETMAIQDHGVKRYGRRRRFDNKAP